MRKIDFTTIAQGGIAEKLKIARQGAGLSTREVANRLASVLAVSHATVANYEKGRSQPTLSLLSELANLYGRPLNWFLEKGPTLTGIRYRSQKSRINATEKHWFESQSLRWLDAYIKVETYSKVPLQPKCQYSYVSQITQPEPVARKVREVLRIGLEEPIPSIVDALEAFGIRVIEMPTDLRIDGMAAMLGDQPVVVLNPKCSHDRLRINGAHELFHHLLGHCDGITTVNEKDDHKTDEDLSFACARHFLLPKAKLEEAFSGQSFVKLIKFKEMFGISLSAMIYAARQERILTDAMARFLWIELSRRGWRVKEPGYVRPDRATRFEQLIDCAIGEQNLSWQEISSIAGVREDELRMRVRLAMGISDPVQVEPQQAKEGGEPTFSGLRLAK